MRTNEYENMGISQRRDFSAHSGTDIIVISKLLKRHSKAKRRAPSYSRALRQIKGVVQRIVRWRLRSGCQRVRGGRLDVKAVVTAVYAKSGEKDQMSQVKGFEEM